VVRDDQCGPTWDLAGDGHGKIVATPDRPECAGEAMRCVARIAWRCHPSATELGECGEQAAADVA